jgi:mannitol-specific phosphotransferase system IIBC component
MCVCLRIEVLNTYLAVFSSYCVLYVASFPVLFIFDCSFGILYRLYILHCSSLIVHSVLSNVYILLVLLVAIVSVFKLFYLYRYVLEHVNCTRYTCYVTTVFSKSVNAAMCTISVKSVTYLVDTCMTMWFRIDSMSTSSTFWKQKRKSQLPKTNKKQKQKTKTTKQNKTKENTIQYITCHQDIGMKGDMGGLFIKYACMHFLYL